MLGTNSTTGAIIQPPLTVQVINNVQHTQTGYPPSHYKQNKKIDKLMSLYICNLETPYGTVTQGLVCSKKRQYYEVVQTSWKGAL